MSKGKGGADDVPYDHRYYEFADILNQIPDIRSFLTIYTIYLLLLLAKYDAKNILKC